MGIHRWLSGEESTCQCKRCRRCGFDPWVRKIPWRRKQQPTPVFLLGESHGQRSLAGCSPWGHRELDMTKNTQTHMFPPCPFPGEFFFFFFYRKWCWILSKAFSLLIEMLIQFLFIKSTTSKTTLIKSQRSLIFYLTWGYMTKCAKKVGIICKYRTSYGVSLRKMVRKIICPFHHKKGEEASYGVWHRGSCMKMVAGGADPTTPLLQA